MSGSATGKWDVIHFNFGIHDRATPAADYEQRLETIVTRLKATGAKVIWATTTPVPPDTKDGPEATQQIIEKNEIAARVMRKTASPSTISSLSSRRTSPKCRIRRTCILREKDTIYWEARWQFPSSPP